MYIGWLISDNLSENYIRGFLMNSFRFPEKLSRTKDGSYYVDVDWVAFYQLSVDLLDQMINDQRLMSDEEARDTGLLASKYTNFLSFIAFLELFTISTFF